MKATNKRKKKEGEACGDSDDQIVEGYSGDDGHDVKDEGLRK